MSENSNEDTIDIIICGQPFSATKELMDGAWDDMNRCQCGAVGKYFDCKDSDIVWCPNCGRLYIMPIHTGLTVNPEVPNITQKYESEKNNEKVER